MPSIRFIYVECGGTPTSYTSVFLCVLQWAVFLVNNSVRTAIFYSTSTMQQHKSLWAITRAICRCQRTCRLLWSRIVKVFELEKPSVMLEHEIYIGPLLFFASIKVVFFLIHTISCFYENAHHKIGKLLR